jgi:integrase
MRVVAQDFVVATLVEGWKAPDLAPQPVQVNFAKRRKLIDDFPHLKALDTHDDMRVRYLGQRDAYERQPLGERDRFLAAVNDPRTEPHLRIATLIAYWTGARRGEVFGLTWGEVSFAKEMVTFRAHTSKSAKTRHVPLHAELKAVLQAWWQAQGEPNGSALVIPSPRTPSTNLQGDPLTTVKRGWATLCRRA